MATTYQMIQTTTLGTSQASVTFSAIPSTYTDLVLVGSAKSLLSGTDSIGIAVNGNGSAIYSRTYLQANGTAVTSGRQTAQIRIVSDYIMGTSGTADFGVYTWNFMNYSNTTTYKTMLVRYNSASAAAGTAVLLWRSTSAITTFSFNINSFGSSTGDFITGSTFTLYGIKAA